MFWAKTCYWLVARISKYYSPVCSNRWLHSRIWGSGNIWLSWHLLLVVLGHVFQPVSSVGNHFRLWKRGWQGKEKDEITAGELLWLSFHRAQWLKVNLEFCTLSDCPGVFLTSNIQSCRLQAGIKTASLLLDVWNFSFRLSNGSKAYERRVSSCHCINVNHIFTHWNSFSAV